MYCYRVGIGVARDSATLGKVAAAREPKENSWTEATARTKRVLRQAWYNFRRSAARNAVLVYKVHTAQHILGVQSVRRVSVSVSLSLSLSLSPAGESIFGG